MVRSWQRPKREYGVKKGYKMVDNLTEEERERRSLIEEIRNALLLALRYGYGENINYIRVSTHIREGLDKLDKLEGNII